MIICIDSSMGVNSMGTPLSILHRNKSHSLDGEIFVTIEYAKSKSPSKLIGRLHEKELKITDFDLFNEKQKIATSLGFIRNDKGILFKAYGIINYKDANFIFKAQLKDSFLYKSFFIETLNNIEFFGEPNVKEDTKLKDEFEKYIIEGLKDTAAFSESFITIEKLFENAPKEEIAEYDSVKLKKEKEMMSGLLSNWKSSTYRVSENFKRSKKLKIINSEYRLDPSSPIGGFYDFLLTIKDHKNKILKVRGMGFELKDKIYLGKLKLEE